ncbi:lamin tail domain-containing protein, partial [Thiomicrospira sp.]|uniref:lamin tail domain-containing protein n=1 Tax=Thiomicrospira sp. TaxID=935 RepID=UPI002F951958
CKWGLADGGPYSNTIGMTLSSGDTYVTNSNIPAQTDGTIVYYVIEATDGEPETTTSPQQSYTVSDIEPEPSNYPTAFAAAEDHATAITTSWTDATGAVIPSGYLVLANLTGTFSPPADGSPVVDDTDLSDGSGAMNIASGVEAYQWTMLSPNTQYFFTIYPYTNSGASIDYKTDGTPPTDNATTNIANTDLFISEVTDPSDDANSKYVEIYNAGVTIVDFSSGSWYLSRQANGGSWADVQLTGIISVGETYVIANSQSNFTTSFGFEADQYSGVISGNGDDGYFLYYNGDHATGTLIDAYGVIDEDGTGKAWEYLDSKAVRLRSVTAPSSTWIASEWDVPSSADVDDMTPSAFKEDVTWTGTTDTDWNTKGNNWSGTYGYIPDASFNVTIPAAANSPVISSESACFDLTMNAGSSLDLPVNLGLTVYGNLATSGTLTIESNASGNGSLIVEGTATGSATVQRYFVGYTGADNGWHNIGSPVDNMA